MKIIAVGRNYTEHIAELDHAVPDEPVIFLKPDTALLKNNGAFYLPGFSQEIHHEIEVVLRICKEGKHVPEKFAGNYVDAVGLGIDFTARDLQQRLKKQGLPWERAKAFDHSAPMNPLRTIQSLDEVASLDFHLTLNGRIVQQGNTRQMLFPPARLISYISTFITLRKGDLLFTGTPSGVGRVAIGDRLEGYLDGSKLLDFNIK